MLDALVKALGLLWSLLLAVPVPVQAQAQTPKTTSQVAATTPRPGPGLAALHAAVNADDIAAVDAALTRAAREPSAARVDTITALLRSGASDAVTTRLIAALAATGSPQAVTPLTEASLHRVAAVRVAAIVALSTLSRPNNVNAETMTEHVALGLRDSDASVRGAAALALGAIADACRPVDCGTAAQLHVLGVAFERGVPEAAVAIGKLANDTTFVALKPFLGRKPLTQVLAGYHELLTRKDISEASKLAIIATLEDVAGITVKRFLQALLSGGALHDQPAVTHAAIATVSRIAEPAGVVAAPAEPTP